MAIIHCLWIGFLAGLVAARLVRWRAPLTAATSTVAVGVLGALLGGLADSWLGTQSGSVPYPQLVWPAIGACLALVAWTLAQRTVFATPAQDKPSDAA